MLPTGVDQPVLVLRLPQSLCSYEPIVASKLHLLLTSNFAHASSCTLSRRKFEPDLLKTDKKIRSAAERMQLQVHCESSVGDQVSIHMQESQPSANPQCAHRPWPLVWSVTSGTENLAHDRCTIAFVFKTLCSSVVVCTFPYFCRPIFNTMAAADIDNDIRIAPCDALE